MHGEAARQRNDTMMSSGGDAAKHKLPGNYKLTCVKQYKDGLRLKSKLRLVLPISMLLPCTCMSNSLCRSAIYITMLKLFHTTSGKWWLQVQQCQMMAARKRQPNRTHCVTQDPSVQCRLSFGLRGFLDTLSICHFKMPNRVTFPRGDILLNKYYKSKSQMEVYTEP